MKYIANIFVVFLGINLSAASIDTLVNIGIYHHIKFENSIQKSKVYFISETAPRILQLEYLNNLNKCFVIEFYETRPSKNSIPIDKFETCYFKGVIAFKSKNRFFKIYSSEDKNGYIDVKLQPVVPLNDCSYLTNKYNSKNYPSKVEHFGRGNNSYELCLEGCQVQNATVDGKPLLAKIKWLKIKSDNSDFIKLKSEKNWTAILYGIYNDQIYFQGRYDLSLETNIVEVSNYKELLIGIFNTAGATKSTIHVENYSKVKSCIDFVSNNTMLEVIATSKGSPVKGPFLNGEKITFKYSIDKWLPVKGNWLQGININMGKGLKYYKDTSDLLIYSYEKDSINFDSISNNSSISYRVENDGNSRNNASDFSIKNYESGPKSNKIELRWGRKSNFRAKQAEEQYYSMIFTLVVDSLINCVPIESEISIAPITDFELGGWKLKGCSENKDIKKKCNISCCKDDASLNLQDTTICFGDSILLSKLNKFKGYYELVTSSLDLEKYPFGKAIKSSDFENKPDTIEVKCHIEMDDKCAKDYTFKVTIKKEEKDAKIMIDDCKLMNALPVEIVRNEYGDIYNFSLIKEPKSYISNSTNRWICAFETNEVCYENIAIELNSEKCDEVSNSSFSYEILPNKTMDVLNLKVLNNSNRNDFNVEILNQNGIPIEIFDINAVQFGTSWLSHSITNLYPGIYYTKIIYEGQSYIQNFIKI